MESGEFKKRNLPYGYRWDEEHSNMVFDEETAPIVQKIFQWKIEGLSLPAIADRLDAMNAPNPEFQKYQVGVRTGNATAKKIWNKSSLTTILDNPHYVGDTVLGRTLNAIYKGVKNQHIDREEWIVFPILTRRLSPVRTSRRYEKCGTLLQGQGLRRWSARKKSALR